MTRLEALNNNSSKWKSATEKEIKSLRDNGTWTLGSFGKSKHDRLHVGF